MPELAAGGIVTEARVRLGTLMAVPDMLRKFGVDPRRVLVEFDLDPADFEDPDHTIPFATEGRILVRCAEVTRCPHFGLLTGQRATLSVFGALGFLVQSAPSVRTALRIATHHFRVHNPGAAVEVIEDGSYVTFRYTILQENMAGREQVLDEAMAVEFNVMRVLCGPDWLPNEVHFAHGPPPDRAPFRKFFRAALRFEQDETALVFGQHWLDAVPPGADPLLNRMMAQRVSELERFFGEDLVGQLRRMLPPLVAARSASLDDVARRVGLGPRTLIRRLAAEGTSFMQLREDARYLIASQLLETTHMLASDIAERIGYANPSAFTRAFLRWTGSGPADWRASRRKRFSKRPRTSGRSTKSDRPRAAGAGWTKRPK